MIIVCERKSTQNISDEPPARLLSRYRNYYLTYDNKYLVVNRVIESNSKITQANSQTSSEFIPVYSEKTNGILSADISSDYMCICADDDRDDIAVKLFMILADRDEFAITNCKKYVDDCANSPDYYIHSEFAFVLCWEFVDVYFARRQCAKIIMEIVAVAIIANDVLMLERGSNLLYIFALDIMKLNTVMAKKDAGQLAKSRINLCELSGEINDNFAFHDIYTAKYPESSELLAVMSNKRAIIMNPAASRVINLRFCDMISRDCNNYHLIDEFMLAESSKYIYVFVKLTDIDSIYFTIVGPADIGRNTANIMFTQVININPADFYPYVTGDTGDVPADTYIFYLKFHIFAARTDKIILLDMNREQSASRDIIMIIFLTIHKQKNIPVEIANNILYFYSRLTAK